MSQRSATPRHTTTKLTAAVGILTMLFGALLVFAPGAGAANNDTQEWDLAYIGLTVADGDSTFRYQLTRTPLSASPADNKLSHMEVGGFCAQPIGVVPAFTPDEGNKWDSADLVKSGDFYDITFSGDYSDAVDPVGSTWTLKKGNGDFSEKVIKTSGPDCDPVDPCEDALPGDLVCNPCDPQGDDRDECDPCFDALPSDLECSPCEQGDQRDECGCLDALPSDTDCFPCEQGDERDECDPCRDAAPTDLQCNPCLEEDTRPACSPPPPPTCVELGTCPPPPPPAEEPDDATLTIVKVVENGPDEWSFPFDGGDLGTFDLTHLDSDQSFEALDADAYTVTEIDSGLATLEAIECDEGADVDVDLAAATVTVDLAEGDDVTCTFTNVYDVEVLPENPPTAETPAAKTPAAPTAAPVTPTEEVLGGTVTRTLPRTGSSSTGTLALAGGALMLLGAALVVVFRPRRR